MRLTKCNTPHSKPSLSREEETYWVMISSYPGAQNREEARRLEDQHRGEHRRLPDKATPRSTLRSTKDKDGTTTSDRVEGSQTRSKSKKPTRTDSLEK